MGVKSTQKYVRERYDGGEFVSGKYQGYHTTQFGDATPTVDAGHTATGGAITDYVEPTGDIYRAHIFVGSGTFNVTALSNAYPAHIEYLVVAGGGAGGYEGGGGAGGLRTNSPSAPSPVRAPNTNFPISVSPGAYTVTIGAGGYGGGRGSAPALPIDGPQANGSPSSLASPTAPETITSTGGGRGGYHPTTAGNTGGSAGGAGSSWAPGALSAGNTPPVSPPQGYP